MKLVFVYLRLLQEDEVLRGQCNAVKFLNQIQFCVGHLQKLASSLLADNPSSLFLSSKRVKKIAESLKVLALLIFFILFQDSLSSPLNFVTSTAGAGLRRFVEIDLLPCKLSSTSRWSISLQSL